MINYWIIDKSGTMEKEGFTKYADAMRVLDERAAQHSTATPIVNGQFSYYDPFDDSWYEVEIYPEVDDDGA